MRTNMIGWIQRLVALVFILGLIGIIAAVFILVRQAEGVPPLPIFTGLLGAVGLILLAGACLALISMANSMQRGVEALQKISAQGARNAPSAPVPVSAKPFTPTAFQDAPQQPEQTSRSTRPAGRVLVAER